MGPKLYEKSWIELTKQGYLARVKCIEIRIKMTDVFMKEYRGRDVIKKNYKKNLYTGNPNKFRILQYLIHHHRKENHKILVFSDTLGTKTSCFLYLYKQNKNYYKKSIENVTKRNPPRVRKNPRISLHRLRSKIIRKRKASAILPTPIKMERPFHFPSRRRRHRPSGRQRGHSNQFFIRFETTGSATIGKNSATQTTTQGGFSILFLLAGFLGNCGNGLCLEETEVFDQARVLV